MLWTLLYPFLYKQIAFIIKNSCSNKAIIYKGRNESCNMPDSVSSHILQKCASMYRANHSRANQASWVNGERIEKTAQGTSHKFGLRRIR